METNVINYHVYIYLYLQKKNSNGKWVTEKTVVDKQKITIPASGLIKLDVGKDNNGKQVFKGWNNLNVVPKVKGDYRVFAGIVFGKQKTCGIWEFRVV